ncbi:GMC oxidoreductase [Apiospora kogelbergensis]|uniref:GMC oxidoreductase n=1 Tax=Apiospora kogelbergensis TaxID=1337665 RepID=A0AAW0QLU7_9PEZI
MTISRSSLLWTLATASALVATSTGFAIPRSAYQAHQVRDASELLPTYDYVFVGGGTAALTVADRLTEDPDTTVLVLEAGPFADPATTLPVNAGGTQRQPFWNFSSVPQARLGGQSFPVLLGRMVGGGSGGNGMAALRGSAEDYDRWGRLFETNELGWDWEGLLPYFKKATNFVPPPADVAERFNITYDTSYWGTDASIYTSWPPFQYPGLDPLVTAFGEMPGVEYAADSGAGRAGVYWFPTLMDPVKHERSFALNGHYENVRRPNYHLMADTLVRRVLLDDDASAAKGVEFITKNQTFTVDATKEVIVSAGAVHTPKVLQLSGIGPRKVLEAAGIKTLVDLPGVGQNFMEHVGIATNITIEGLRNIHPNGFDLVTNATFREWVESAWETDRSGPYSIAFNNIAGWLPLSAITPSLFESFAQELEAQDHASYLPEGTDPTVAAGYRMQMQQLAVAMRSRDTVFARFAVNATLGGTNPIMNQPLSRGTINIDARDPFGAPPLVDYRTLSNPLERRVLVEMVKWLRRYSFETSLGGLRPLDSAPGPDVVSDDQIAAWLDASSVLPSDYHPAGTAAMMPLALGGVVDQTLRVYGVRRLRVVDASIMPNLPGANTCQPVYAIAEKAADMIKSNV